MMSIESRYGKALDIRRHKKDWLDIRSLRRMQDMIREFCEFTLQHPDRVKVDSCPVCASNRSDPYGTTYNIPYLQCGCCGHVYAQFKLTDEALAEYYRGHYFEESVYLDKTQVAQRTQMLLEPKVKFVAEGLQSGQRRWLDVGTGNGGVVACARAMGFEAEGIELGANAIQFAKEVFGIEIHHRAVDEELRVHGPGYYDVVSYFMVLEHVTDPRFQVRCAHQLLRAGGKLVVEVPKADSVAAWGDIAYPNQGLRQMVSDHIMLYTTDSLHYLLEKNGFRVERQWFMGQDVFNMILHMALQEPSFLKSPLCNFLLDANNELQQVIDNKKACDEIIVVATKVDNPS